MFWWKRLEWTRRKCLKSSCWPTGLALTNLALAFPLANMKTSNISSAFILNSSTKTFSALLSTRFAFLFIQGFYRYKIPVHLNREFFVSGPIRVHYLALAILIWQLNNLSNTKLKKKRTYHFSSDKISLRVNDSSIPKFWTRYELYLEN